MQVVALQPTALIPMVHSSTTTVVGRMQPNSPINSSRSGFGATAPSLVMFRVVIPTRAAGAFPQPPSKALVTLVSSKTRDSPLTTPSVVTGPVTSGASTLLVRHRPAAVRHSSRTTLVLSVTPTGVSDLSRSIRTTGPQLRLPLLSQLPKRQAEPSRP